MTTLPADGASFSEAPTSRVSFDVDPPAPPPKEAPLVVVGVAVGAATALAVMFVYQLVRIGWQLAHEATRQGATPAPGLESPDRIFGVLVVGGLLSLAPTILAGGLLGGVLGGFLSWTAERQGLVRSWLSGSLVAYVAALIVNVSVLARHRLQPLEFTEWRRLIGIPSLLFVLIFGGVGVYLYLRQTGRTD